MHVGAGVPDLLTNLNLPTAITRTSAIHAHSPLVFSTPQAQISPTPSPPNIVLYTVLPTTHILDGGEEGRRKARTRLESLKQMAAPPSRALSVCL